MTADAPVARYSFEPSCLVCGGQLHHVTDGLPGISTKVVAECRACDPVRQYVIGAAIRDVTAEVRRDKPENVAARERKARVRAAGQADESGEAAA